MKKIFLILILLVLISGCTEYADMGNFTFGIRKTGGLGEEGGPIIVVINQSADEIMGLADYKDFLPEEIAGLTKDFYPAGLSRKQILAKLPEAVPRTGRIGNDTWSDVILVTGDLEAENLVIEPGTFVFVEAGKDDQKSGAEMGTDPVNPHEFLGEDYQKTHISIRVRGELNAKGNPDKPIIFTSTSETPSLSDWDHLEFEKGVLEYAVVENLWGISIRSSDAKISHCVIRNLLQQGIMFGTLPYAGIYGEAVSPEITYNYIYNFGHMAVQSFFSEPHISNNIFIQKLTEDPEMIEYLGKGENGGLDIHGGNGTIERNFLSCGNLSSSERANLGCPGIGITEASYPIIKFNTMTGNKWGIELQGGLPAINNNNILGNEQGHAVVRTIYSEPGRESQGVAYTEPLDFRHNWWGTNNTERVTSKMDISLNIQREIEPIATAEIPEAFPDWSEFGWLWG
jgi:parallel beta-helix repeat protein